MNDTEQEKLAELIAIKVSEKYFQITKEYIEKEIQLHEAKCSLRKASKFFSLIWACIGGGCVAFINWLINKI